MKKKFVTKNGLETEAIASQVLAEILKYRILLLSGELGSGKTTFVKGLAKALGIQQLIKSPTYTYVNKYEIRTPRCEEKYEKNMKQERKKMPEFVSDLNHLNFDVVSGLEFRISDFSVLHHFDLYRLPESSEDPEHTKASIGLEDALNDAQALVIIEWPERLPIEFPHLQFHFKKNTSNHEILCYTP